MKYWLLGAVLLSLVLRAEQITTATSARVVEVAVTTTVSSATGRRESVVNINEIFRITVTNATAMRIDSSQGELTTSTYSNEVLRIVTGSETSVFTSIATFAAVQAVGENQEPVLTLYGSADNVTLYGACQVHVNEHEGVSFYIQDYRLVEGTNVADIINRQVFMQTFRITIIDGTASVTDTNDVAVIRITSNSHRFVLPLARQVTYSPLLQTLVFENMDNTTTSFSNISSFSIFFRNKLEVFDSSENASEITISLSNGGILYINKVEGTALFTSNSNPTVAVQLDSAAQSISARYSYTIELNALGVYHLVVTRENDTSSDTRETILVLTGALVIDVEGFHTVSYNNDEVVITGIDGTLLIRLVSISRFVVSSDVVPFISYSGLSSVLFSGPGTLVVSRGTGFFTTDTSLGESVSFAVSRAGIPLVQYERVHVSFNVIGGTSYAVGAVVQRIGGEIVSVYEAESYNTHKGEVILYVDGEVSVHESTVVSSGGISYTGSEQILTYSSAQGVQVLRDVEIFYLFNGGHVEVFTASDNVSVTVPGRLFVSENGTEVLFIFSEIITPSVANLIRQLVVPEISLTSGQFGSVTGGVYQLSTFSAPTLYIGGGRIWYRVYDGTAYVFYIDDVNLQVQVIEAVNSILGITKFVPRGDLAWLSLVFNGGGIYSYVTLPGNVEIRISSTESFTFNGSVIYGNTIRVPYSGVTELVTFDGMEVRMFNSSVTAEFVGPGLLLVQLESGTAFFTTWPATVNYILQSIAAIRQQLAPPKIERSSTKYLKVSSQSAVVLFGTNVKAYEGADVEFVCNITSGIPEPQITIFKVDSSGLVPLVESNNTRQSTLLLSGISENDSGKYLCSANNGVPPADEVTSKLLVREAVAPELQPGWFPFVARRGELIIWPTSVPETTTFDVHTVRVLHFACLVDGKPRGEVVWRFNGAAIEVILGPTANVTEVRPGRSVLSIGVDSNIGILSGTNSVECSAGNVGGVTSGGVITQGVVDVCNPVGEGPCSSTCGIGIQERMFECSRSQGGSPPVPIPASEVSEEVLPLEERSHPCTPLDTAFMPIICPITEYRWRASEWSTCSRSCGTGVRHRKVNCIALSVPVSSLYQAQLDNVTESVAEDSMCVMSREAGEKPSDRETCSLQTCPFWQTSQYSECNVTCGGGVRVRSVTCNVIIGRFRDTAGKIQLNLTVVNETLCNMDDRPSDTQPCFIGRCPFEWRLGQYHECGNVALPDEFRFCKQRRVFCYNANPNPIVGSRVVPEALCADQKQPISLASCGRGRCFNGIWGPLSWSNCSEECGYGLRSREVLCYSPVTLTQVPREFCDSSTMPVTKSRCFLRNCENTCLRDEHLTLCPMLARRGLCGSPFAMANNGTRCCASCMGTNGRD